MDEKRCPSCGQVWPPAARRCTCGHEFTPTARPAPIARRDNGPRPVGSAYGGMSIGCGCLATWFLWFGLGMIDGGPNPTPGPAGFLIDLMWFWIPLTMISAAAFGIGAALISSQRRVGAIVGTGWIVLVLLWMLIAVVQRESR